MLVHFGIISYLYPQRERSIREEKDGKKKKCRQEALYYPCSFQFVLKERIYISWTLIIQSCGIVLQTVESL